MTSWYSKAYSAATSQISSLRSTLLSSDADGDTEDDTHVCRVLRGYYTEKGRPFPAWLPPDPKAPPPAAPMTASTQPVAGSRYGNFNPSASNTGPATAPAATGLSSLWGNDGGASNAPTQPRRGPGGRTLDFGDQQERAASAGVATSAQDRFRNRMYGGSRTASPATNGPFAPPRGSSSSGGGGSGSGDYEDRFAPGNYNTGGDNTGYGAKPAVQRRAVGLPSGPRMR